MSNHPDAAVVIARLGRAYPHLEIESDTKHCPDSAFVGIFFPRTEVIIHADISTNPDHKSYSGYIDNWGSKRIKSEGAGESYDYTGPDSLMAQIEKWLKKRIELYEEFEAELDELDKEWGNPPTSMTRFSVLMREEMSGLH